jgi:hypothetical protein
MKKKTDAESFKIKRENYNRLHATLYSFILVNIMYLDKLKIINRQCSQQAIQ